MIRGLAVAGPVLARSGLQRFDTQGGRGLLLRAAGACPQIAVDSGGGFSARRRPGEPSPGHRLGTWI